MLEVNYKLQSFGILNEMLPIDNDGNISLDYFQAYLRDQIDKEQMQKELEYGKIFHPRATDILMGRGRHQQEHQGNLYLTKLVEDHKEMYKSSRKNDKKHYPILLVKTIQENGGRFLKRSTILGEGWTVVDDDVALGKVRNKFREAGPTARVNFASDDNSSGTVYT